MILLNPSAKTEEKIILIYQYRYIKKQCNIPMTVPQKLYETPVSRYFKYLLTSVPDPDP